MRIKNFELRLYLEGWLNNVGYSQYDDGSGAFTLMLAMREPVSLRDWFGTADVDYDDEFALRFLKENYTRA